MLLACSLFSLLVLLTGLNVSLASPSSTTNTHKPPNANHIFNAIHSAGRQWHESLHHNGLSFFLATIPAGTHLYHGRGDAAPVTGMDWLAFEPEHAANFAFGICNASSTPELSPKWTWTWDVIAAQENPHATETGQMMMMHHPAHQHDPEDSTPLQATLAAATAQGQARLLSPASKPRPPPQNFTVCPGYLHTYTTQRTLRLLYIDGMSAAKSPLGTLNTQDQVLLRHSALRPKHTFDDFHRAQSLCELARTPFGGRIDGFVRMEHGFEVVLCEFDGVLRRESVLRRSSDRSLWPAVGRGAAFWQFLGAITDRYQGVGGGRLRIALDGMVSVFAYPEVNVWADSEDGVLPNISQIEDTAAGRIAADVRSLVVDGVFPGDDQTSSDQQQVDWKAVAELYVTRYARRLMYLASSQIFTSAEERANATRSIYAVYMDDKVDGGGASAAERCTNAFLPPSPRNGLPQRAIEAVALEVCEALYDIMTTLSRDSDAQQRRLETLMSWLRWPEFKACESGRGCGIGELCFVAIWPFGDKQDHEQPRCWDKAGLERHLLEAEDYWRMRELM